MINVSERTSAFQGLRLIFIVDIVFFHAHHEFLGGGITDCSFVFILSGFLYRKRDTSYISYLWVKIKKYGLLTFSVCYFYSWGFI